MSFTDKNFFSPIETNQRKVGVGNQTKPKHNHNAQSTIYNKTNSRVFSLTEIILTRLWDENCPVVKPQKLSCEFPICYTQIVFDTGSSISLYTPGDLALAKDNRSELEQIRFTGVNHSLVTICRSFTIQIVRFWEQNHCPVTKFEEINVLGKHVPNEKLCGNETPFNEALRPQEWSCQQQDRAGAILLGRCYVRQASY